MLMTPKQSREIVLVVDDSPETLSMVTDALEESGATVLVAQGGEMALSLIEKVTPDVILMDCVMPGLDGFETCKRLKADPGLLHLPVIFMTGLAETDNIIKGFKAGGVDYLTKPIVPEELLARMTVHVANSRHTHSAHTALDKARRHLIATDGDGQLTWCTPHATGLLERCRAEDDNSENTSLPEKIVAWLNACRADSSGSDTDLKLIEKGELRLIASYLGQSGPNEYLFRVIEIDEKKDRQILIDAFDLTAREAEVLLWVAHGKSNKDIADILDFSPRTVNKHLELIFAKLHVENRTSAAAAAMRALWQE